MSSPPLSLWALSRNDPSLPVLAPWCEECGDKRKWLRRTHTPASNCPTSNPQFCPGAPGWGSPSVGVGRAVLGLLSALGCLRPLLTMTPARTLTPQDVHDCGLVPSCSICWVDFRAPRHWVLPWSSRPVLSTMELEASRQLSRRARLAIPGEARRVSPAFPEGPGLLAASSVMCLDLVLS